METSRDGTPSVPGAEAKLSTFICLCFDSHYPPPPPLPLPPPLARLLLIGSAGSEQLHTRREDLGIKVWFTGKLMATWMHHQRRNNSQNINGVSPLMVCIKYINVNIYIYNSIGG